MAHVTTADEAEARAADTGIFIDLEAYPEVAEMIRVAIRERPYLTDANMGGLDALKAETYRVWRHNVWYANEHEE